MEFNTVGKLIEYLQNNFYGTDFKKNHTRPQLVKILKTLYPNLNFTKSMCKERQIEHIEFWLKLHHKGCLIPFGCAANERYNRIENKIR